MFTKLNTQFMKNILVVLLIIICIDIQSQDTKDIPVITDVNAVTVFINGAQVFRKKTIDVNSGKSTIKFTNLSPYLDPKSIHVKIEGEVIVLSVNHQFNYLDTMGQLKELEELNNKLINIQDKIKIENTNLEIILEELTFLKDNRIIGGKNQEVSLLNLKETSVYYGERMTTLKTKEVEVNKNIQLLDQ